MSTAIQVDTKNDTFSSFFVEFIGSFVKMVGNFSFASDSFLRPFVKTKLFFQRGFETAKTESPRMLDSVKQSGNQWFNTINLFGSSIGSKLRKGASVVGDSGSSLVALSSTTTVPTKEQIIQTVDFEGMFWMTTVEGLRSLYIVLFIFFLVIAILLSVFNPYKYITENVNIIMYTSLVGIFFIAFATSFYKPNIPFATLYLRQKVVVGFLVFITTVTLFLTFNSYGVPSYFLIPMYFLLTLFLFTILMIFNSLSDDSQGFLSTTSAYDFILNSMKMIGIVLLTLFGFLLLTSFVIKLFHVTPNSGTTKVYDTISAFAIIVTLLAIFFKLYRMIRDSDPIKKNEPPNPYLAYMYEMLSFIPCLLIDLIEFPMKEYKRTPVIGVMIFTIEILSLFFLLFLCLFYSYVSKKYYYEGGLQILSDPVGLEKSRVLSDNATLYDILSSTKKINQYYNDASGKNSVENQASRAYRDLKNCVVYILYAMGFYNLYYRIVDKSNVNIKNDLSYLYESENKVLDAKNNSKINPVKYTFSLSFWFYIDSNNSMIDKDFLIMNYTINPYVVYNPMRNIFTVYILDNMKYKECFLQIQDANRGVVTDDEDYACKVKNSLSVYSTTHLKLQRWNHFVLVCSHGLLDIFINNELVSSQKMSIPVLEQNTIVSGTDEGLNGGVCNVLFFKENLTAEKINILYTSVEKKNPPVPTVSLSFL